MSSGLGRSHLDMNRFILILVLLASANAVRSAEFKFPNQTFTVPDGFEVELVAGPPLVDRPVTIDFDDEGRLYVTDSSGSNDKVDKQLQEKPHRIVRLEDTDGDGTFDKSKVFADKMMFPEGCLWYDGSLYVAAPPSIWKLTDTDGDGAVDQRQEWFQGKTLTGCANDLHGPSLGPDGWIYWCKGAFAQQTYPRPGKPPFTTKAAHIFRSRPDGSGIEPVLTGGMDNPVSVAFTAGGERILTGTFFVHPGGGHRDGLIHAIYGGVYGKDHDVIYDHKQTGGLMPIMTHHGPSASCFVARYEADGFGKEYRDNLFACLFNLHKVVRHVLIADGATFKTRDEDFLVSDNPDFHPTSLLEDADGSLLVVDTGGWYKICCPTSQLWKPDVLGAIYRVRRTGAPKRNDPRGAKIAWATASSANLAALLADDRPFVRNRAIRQLAKQGAAAVPDLAGAFSHSNSSLGRLNAIWALTRIEGPEARRAVHAGLSAHEPEVVTASLHSISAWRDHSAPASKLIQLLGSSSPALQRVAAEAIGRLGLTEAVPQLLSAAGKAGVDRVLEHSLIFALIEIGDRPGTVKGLDSSSSGTHRAALIALDQMDDGELKPETVTPLLAAADPALKQTASWIVSHHPEWASALAHFFKERLKTASLPQDERAELERQLGQFARDAAIQALLVETARASGNPLQARLSALRAMGRANLKEVPSSWTECLIQLLASHDNALIAAAVSTARSVSGAGEASRGLNAALATVGHNKGQPSDVRLEAFAAMRGALASLDSETFDFLRANLDPSKPVLLRSTAAGILAKAKLTTDQLAALADSLKAAGPMEVPKLLEAFEKSSDARIGHRLVAALKTSAGLAALRPDTLRARLTNFPEQVQEESKALLAMINTDAAQEKEHLDELLPFLKEGDVRRGQAVFNSQKAACATCHAIGYLGGNIGPDLTRIGQIRTERDLLEAVLYPSASFVRSYEPVRVTTKSGEDYNGVVRRDAPEELVLGTGPGTETRITRADIADMQPGTTSVMPGGLEQVLSRQELLDVVAFLRATRW